MPRKYIKVGRRTLEEACRRVREVITKDDRRKQALCIMTAAQRKRETAQALWDEAEKDMAQAQAMLDEELPQSPTATDPRPSERGPATPAAAPLAGEASGERKLPEKLDMDALREMFYATLKEAGGMNFQIRIGDVNIAIFPYKGKNPALLVNFDDSFDIYKVATFKDQKSADWFVEVLKEALHGEAKKTVRFMKSRRLIVDPDAGRARPLAGAGPYEEAEL